MLPQQFNLLGHTILVKIDNKYCQENECIGQFIPWSNTIMMATKYKTEKTWRKYKPSVIEHTFHHELIHCILYYTGHEDLWLNEQLVDLIGGLYHQYETTKIERNEVINIKSES
jgi:hypothetical protein